MRVLPRIGLAVCTLLFGCDDSSDAHLDIGGDGGRPLDAGAFHGDASMDAGLLDARAPASDAAADGGWYVDPGPSWPACTALPSDFQFKTLLQASDYGADATFKALSGGYVLVGAGSGDQVLDVFPGPSDDGKVDVGKYPLPAGRAGIGIAANLEGGGGFVTLACTGANAACSLLRSAAPEQPMVEIAGSSLPDGFRATGLSSDQGVVCAYGNGVFCFRDGAWKSALAGIANDDIVDVALGSLSVAISFQGQVWASHVAPGAAPDFQKIGQTQSAPLERVNVSGDAAFISGHQFVWAVQNDSFDPNGFGLVSAAWLARDGAQQALELASGHFLKRTLDAPDPGWCEDPQKLDIPKEALIDTDNAPCGLSQNFRLLTTHALIGQNVCPLD